MSCWKLVCRLRPPCSSRLEVISGRSVKLSFRTLSLKRSICTNKRLFRSSSSVVEETNCVSVNDKEHKSQEIILQSTQTTSTFKELEGGSELDKDTRIKSKILFNTHLFNVDPEHQWLRKRILEKRQAQRTVKEINEHGFTPMKSHALKYLDGYVENKDVVINESQTEEEQLSPEEDNVHFPFADSNSTQCFEAPPTVPNKYLPRKLRLEKLKALDSDETLRGKVQNVMDERWMSDYEHFQEISLESWTKMYGTPMKNVPVSKIPCGGCGAFFQCQEPAIPGYLPSEIFRHVSSHELKTITCQRCHFLKNYEIALDVQMPPAEYPAVLDEISKRRGIVILMIDLLDFPCSIWPGITNLIGDKRPVIVVGNKVDLLPGTHHGYLNRIKQAVLKSLRIYGLSNLRLKNLHLISARSGFGVEGLITDVHRILEYKGDVFLVGCTNVGKSTLFNCLLQSDLCKAEATDLVQRATTSPWPNTTLNLLKFPVMRPAGWKLEQRLKRLQEDNSHQMEMQLRAVQIRNNNIYHMPSLMEFVGRTYHGSRIRAEGAKDVFSANKTPEDKKKLGLNESDPAFRLSRWCYDTPGVAHPDQILTLLTTEELLEVLPSTSLVPRTLRLRLGQSLFVGGLARIDFVDGEDNFAWITLFASDKLPLTVVWTEDAEEVYQYALGTDVLRVPHSGANRLLRWPGLKAAPRPFTLFSETEDASGADLTLSSTGWISVTTSSKRKVTLLPWTPEGRGIHFRIPALIPYAVNFRGSRIPGTPMYHCGKATRKDNSKVVEESLEYADKSK